MAPRLLDVLEEARRRGFLGPGPVEEQVRHAEILAELAAPPPRSFLDLGSGGGIPGLVLAHRWPEAQGVLVDAGERRCRFLREAVVGLTLGGRVQVACGRAEELAREPAWRESTELVVARSFGAPAVTAECAVGFLERGGRLVVSEPPEPDETRWPAAGLRRLGLAGPVIRRRAGVSVAVLTVVEPVSRRWPRRVGIPAKRPLW
ncbi:MAG TPA: RsmG family class I SAM-dependent methyltransferase [Acidimicrobiia bacterium]